MFKVSEKQYKILRWIAYWTFEKAYLSEREPDNKDDLKSACMSILHGFDRADAAGIPCYIVKAVIAYADDWRRYKDNYFDDEMAKLGIKHEG